MSGASLNASPTAPSIQVNATKLTFVRKTDERFQSFQIGMSHLTGGETWRAYDPKRDAGQPSGLGQVREARAAADLANPRLIRLTAALAPLYIRYGGTTSNSVYFQNDDAPKLAKAPDGYSVVLTRAAWKGAIRFARLVDARIVTGFTASSGVRDKSGVWTPLMAQPWLAYTRSIGGRIYAAELFNEPNAPDAAAAPKGVQPGDYARDFAIFRDFARKADPHLKVVGPGVATLGVAVPSLEGFPPETYLSTAPQPKLDILSYHFYGALAERCVPATSPVGIDPARALTEEWLARPDKELKRHIALRDRFAPGAPIWLTETGAAACGGTRWQPTFLDTFRFLDTEARLAKLGLDAMFTHALISGSNGIIDEKTLMPNASYWAAVLWRRLMGATVLDAGSGQPGVHLYAHCMRGVAGGVTLLAINLKDAPQSLDVGGPAGVYSLTATELQSSTVLLNGKALALGKGDVLPRMAAAVSGARIQTLAPYSSTFVTLPRAGNASCRK